MVIPPYKYRIIFGHRRIPMSSFHQFVIISCHHNIILCHCQVIILCHCHIIVFSNCDTIILLLYHTIALSSCHTPPGHLRLLSMLGGHLPFYHDWWWPPAVAYCLRWPHGIGNIIILQYDNMLIQKYVNHKARGNKNMVIEKC